MQQYSPLDLNRNELRQAVLQNLASDPAAGSSTEGQVYYNTASKTVRRFNGTVWADVGAAGSGLSNAYASISDGTNTTTASGSDTFRVIAGGSNLLTVAVAEGTPDSITLTVNGSSTPGANKLVQADGTGKIAAGWVQEVLALADLSDVAGKTGTGTTVVMNTAPTFAPTGGISADMGSGRIANLADPTNPQDAATKAYVDATKQGLDFKDSVRLASTANVTVTYSATGGTSGRGQITAAPNTLDGTALAAGNRILLKNQTTAAQNGIWVVTTLGSGANGVWDRATDFDQDAEVTAGAFVWVTEGTANADTGWVLTTNDPITIGGASGTSLAFTQFSAANSYTFANVGGAGTGVWDSTSGQTVNFRKLNAASNKFSVTLNGQQLDLDVVPGNIDKNTLGGSAMTVANGGTGQTTAAGARGTSGLGAGTAPANATNVTATDGGIPLKRTFVITAPGAVNNFVCTHNLGVAVPMVIVSDNNSPKNKVETEVEFTDTNTVTIKIYPAPAATTVFNVTIIG
jgi:hypothetical protein